MSVLHLASLILGGVEGVGTERSWLLPEQLVVALLQQFLHERHQQRVRSLRDVVPHWT